MVGKHESEVGSVGHRCGREGKARRSVAQQGLKTSKTGFHQKAFFEVCQCREGESRIN